MSATMADVARAAGTSIASVGRVIHNNGYVSKETRRRIEAAIAELGYVPNQSARTLKRSRSGVIGSLVLQSDNGLYYLINDSIIAAAAARGYGCVTMEAQASGRNEAELIERFIGMGVDGLAILSNGRITPAMFALLKQSGTPVAAVERGYFEQGIDSLIVRDFEAVRDAVGRMTAMGHRRIALIAVEPRHDVEARRLGGYRQALLDAGIAPDEGLIRLVDGYSVSNGLRAAESLLAEARPTAIMATADTLAAGALQAAYARRLRVPEDLCVAGCDDVLSRSLSPAIDSIALVLDGVGDAVMDLLLARREDPGRPAERRFIDTRYAARGSVTPPASGK